MQGVVIYSGGSGSLRCFSETRITRGSSLINHVNVLSIASKPKIVIPYLANFAGRGHFFFGVGYVD